MKLRRCRSEVMPYGIMKYCATHKERLSVSFSYRAVGTLHVRGTLHVKGTYRFARETLSSTKQKRLAVASLFCLVGEGGFEPPKLKAADLQSVPFGHSGTLPNPTIEIISHPHRSVKSKNEKRHQFLPVSTEWAKIFAQIP